MLDEQKPFAIITSVVLLALIVYLVRKRKLREEYALLWLLVAAAVMLIAVWDAPLVWLKELIGARDVTSVLYIFSLLFLMVVCIHFSVVNSRLKDQVKDLTQEMALIRKEQEEAEHPDEGIKT